MKNIRSTIATLNQAQIAEDMHEKGYAIVPDFLSGPECEMLKTIYRQNEYYRKTVVMEHYRFGIGEYKYFNYPLPDIIQTIRQQTYPLLAPIANTWMHVLNIKTQFPDTFQAFQELCHADGQLKPTALILKYGQGGYNTLHQDLYGSVYFPIQTVLFLSQEDEDFTGGEFVLIQQTPRAQSEAIVLKLKKGDMLIFTTNYRPVKGTKGYYRVNMKHGVSKVQSGERYVLGIIYHDALS
ncbi:MAG TPA: 2OG-Fe(II) oxygenase [Pedobacter sp.]|nr:2OG-Fe(II) oxygenase [Pedobacter sp.]